MVVTDHNLQFNLVQMLQAASHFLLASVAAFTVPSRYWFHFADPDLVETQDQPLGVQLLYLTSLCYHLYMYFRDPISSTKIHPRHLVTVSTVTVLALCQYFKISLLIILANYLLDMWDFVFRTFKTIDRAQVSSVCITKIHHVLTVLLIAISWVYGRATIGAVIMFVNDVTDVPMFMVRISKRRNKSKLRVATLAAAVLATWIFYRVYYMGFVLHTCLTVIAPRDVINMPSLCCGLALCVLFLFNVYWTSLVVVKTVQVLLLGTSMTKVHSE